MMHLPSTSSVNLHISKSNAIDFNNEKTRPLFKALLNSKTQDVAACLSEIAVKKPQTGFFDKFMHSICMLCSTDYRIKYFTAVEKISNYSLSLLDTQDKALGEYTQSFEDRKAKIAGSQEAIKNNEDNIKLIESYQTAKKAYDDFGGIYRMAAGIFQTIINPGQSHVITAKYEKARKDLEARLISPQSNLTEKMEVLTNQIADLKTQIFNEKEELRKTTEKFKNDKVEAFKFFATYVPSILKSSVELFKVTTEEVEAEALFADNKPEVGIELAVPSSEVFPALLDLKDLLNEGFKDFGEKELFVKFEKMLPVMLKNKKGLPGKAKLAYAVGGTDNALKFQPDLIAIVNKMDLKLQEKALPMGVIIKLFRECVIKGQDIILNKETPLKELIAKLKLNEVALDWVKLNKIINKLKLEAADNAEIKELLDKVELIARFMEDLKNGYQHFYGVPNPKTT